MSKPTGSVPAGASSPSRGAVLYRQVSSLHEPQLCAFLALMARDKESLFGQFFNAFANATVRSRETVDSLLRKLKRHRKPKKNAERDAWVMRLHGGKKTAGQIVLALKGKYQLTDKIVNTVISREKRKSKAE